MSDSDLKDVSVIVYAGAEAPDHAELSDLIGVPVVGDPRALSSAVHDSSEETSVVVPAGTGRDLTSIAQAAQALQWLKTHGASVALAAPALNHTYAIARMRHHIRHRNENCDAVIFLSRTVDPFADAELLRRVRLAQQFSDDVAVEVAFEGDGAWPTLDQVTQRLSALSVANPQVVRADLGLTGEGEALYRATGLRQAVHTVASEAAHMLSHGYDGIDDGLLADHGQGFAHSHGDEEEAHSHTHAHGHSHSHTHGHSHTHTH